MATKTSKSMMALIEAYEEVYSNMKLNAEAFDNNDEARNMMLVHFWQVKADYQAFSDHFSKVQKELQNYI